MLKEWRHRYRRRAPALFAVLAVALLFYWPQSEPSWAIALNPQAAHTTPGRTIVLTAAIDGDLPARETGWTWSWTSTAGALQGNGPTREFRSDTIGTHRISVAAHSPRGTTRTAETTVTVEAVTTDRHDETAGLRAARSSDTNKPKLPFRITSATVDKPEVCRGERTVVRVTAARDGGHTGQLVPSINGRIGWTVMVLVPDTVPGKYKIPVRVGEPGRSVGDTSIEYQQTSAAITLKDCDAPSALWLTSRQPTPREENVWVRASWVKNEAATTEGREPAWYIWDFGDGSPKTRTRTPDVWHIFPNEEERGPGQRVTSYLIKAQLIDTAGRSIADGMLDIALRNRLEELKYTDGRLQLLVQYPPHPRIEGGMATTSVTLKNLDPDETALLTGLEFRLVPCVADRTPAIQPHSVAEVFDAPSVPPRGAVSGQLRWPANDTSDVCHVDVSIRGRSQPSGLAVGGAFSLRLRMDHGVTEIQDNKQAAEIKKAMALLNKRFVTLDDLTRLVASGQISDSVLRPPAPSAAGTQ